MSLTLMLAGLLAISTAQSSQDVEPKPPTIVVVKSGERIEIVGNDHTTVRGRLGEVTADSIVVRTNGGPENIPLAAVQRADRVGDSLINGAAIGAAIGGGTALALMVKICNNTNCSDTSSNLDPRLTLLGTAIGAGVGVLIDKAFEGRRTIYRTGTGQTLAPHDAPRRSTAAASSHPVIFGRVGWGRIDDDEGSLGSGASIGAGVLVPIARRLGLQIQYDRQTRSREFEFGRGFFGTEQLVTAKALFFFRSSEAVRPYAGVGLGFMDSRRRSVSPTFSLGPGLQVISGPPEIFRYHTSGGTLGFAVGMEARVTSRLSMLGDLTLDLGSPEALSSTRLTIGAGWHF